jgi:hypothetical protein
MDMVVPNTALKARIDAWVRERLGVSSDDANMDDGDGDAEMGSSGGGGSGGSTGGGGVAAAAE